MARATQPVSAPSPPIPSMVTIMHQAAIIDGQGLVPARLETIPAGAPFDRETATLLGAAAEPRANPDTGELEACFIGPDLKLVWLPFEAPEAQGLPRAVAGIHV